MKILVTGFEPFGGEATNPSWEAVRRLPSTIGDAEIITRELPTVFGRSAAMLEHAIVEHRPDAVVCVGQAEGRTGLTPERVAINVVDTSIPDNDGLTPQGPIRPDGPAAYFATLPVKAMAAAMRDAGVPASISNTAGTYVCNHLMYELLHLLDRRFPDTVGGFVHVPFSTDQVLGRDVPSLGLDTIVEGLAAALAAVVARHGLATQ